MKSTLSILVAAPTLALLTACGGGGGDGGSATPQVVITSANQTPVARASLNGGSAVMAAQGSLGAGGTSGPLSASHLVRRAIAAAGNQRKAVAGIGAHPATASTDTESCASGGSLTVSVDDRDNNNQLSNGDVLTVTFAQCRDSATTSINGAIAITLTATPTASTLDASANFQNLAVVVGGDSAGISGTVALHEVDGSTLSTVQLTVGSGGLTVTVASSAYNDNVSFEAGMSFLSAESADGTQASESLNGSLSATSIGGRITITTQVPLALAFDSDYPSAGVVKIVGASGSTVLATVLDNTQVQLQLDANGDGSYESSTDVPWTTLLP